MPLSRARLLVLAVLCGCPGPSAPPLDAESPIDAAPRDAAVADAPSPLDAALDAGVPVDAPAAVDAGLDPPAVLCAGEGAMPGDLVTSVASDPSGAIALGGISGNDAFVERFGPDCVSLWRVAITGSGTQSVASISVAEDGSVFVPFSTIGGAAQIAGSTPTSDILNLAHLGPDGTLDWLHPRGNGGIPARVPGSGIVLAGLLVGTVDFDNGATVTSAGGTQVFLVEVGETGIGHWAVASTGTFSLAPGGLSLAVDYDGNVFLGGGVLSPGDTIDFGGRPLVAGSQAAFFGIFSGVSGGPGWTQIYDHLRAPIVAADLAGNLALAAGVEAGADLGDGPAPTDGVVFGTLFGDDGTPLFGRFQDGSFPASVAAGPDLSLFVSLAVVGAGTDFGGGLVPSRGLGPAPGVAVLLGDGTFDSA